MRNVQAVEHVRNREYRMEIRDGKKLPEPGVDPPPRDNYIYSLTTIKNTRGNR
jgi:hypothetical protein